MLYLESEHGVVLGEAFDVRRFEQKRAPCHAATIQQAADALPVHRIMSVDPAYIMMRTTSISGIAKT